MSCPQHRAAVVTVVRGDDGDTQHETPALAAGRCYGNGVLAVQSQMLSLCMRARGELQGVYLMPLLPVRTWMWSVSGFAKETPRVGAGICQDPSQMLLSRPTTSFPSCHPEEAFLAPLRLGLQHRHQPWGPWSCRAALGSHPAGHQGNGGRCSPNCLDLGCSCVRLFRALWMGTHRGWWWLFHPLSSGEQPRPWAPSRSSAALSPVARREDSGCRCNPHHSYGALCSKKPSPGNATWKAGHSRGGLAETGVRLSAPACPRSWALLAEDHPQAPPFIDEDTEPGVGTECRTWSPPLTLLRTQMVCPASAQHRQEILGSEEALGRPQMQAGRCTHSLSLNSSGLRAEEDRLGLTTRASQGVHLGRLIPGPKRCSQGSHGV